MLKYLKNYTILKIMNKKIVSIFLFFLCFLACYAVDARELSTMYEQCYLIKSQGIDIGFICETQEQTCADVVTTQHIEQRFKRQEENIEIIQDQVFVEDLSGKPLSFSFKSDRPGENIVITGEIDWTNREIIIISKTNGTENRSKLPFEGELLFPHSIEKLYRENSSGNIEYTTIEPSITSTVLKVKAEKIEETKYKLSIDIFPNTEIIEWRDKEGKLIKSSSPVMNMEQVAVPKEEIPRVKGQYNVFPESLIKVEKNILEPESVKDVVYKVTALDIPVEGIFLDNSTQNIFQVQDNTAYIKVKAENCKNQQYPYPFDTTGYEEYLKSGPFIITNNPKIISIAEGLKTGETDAVQLANKAQKWVYDHIENKNASISFANSVETLENGCGDCTEHSVLLASILRAAGIPAKTVVGLVYTNTPRSGFVYHMWVKAYIGKWINLDPSMPYEVFTPLHLTMTESTLNNISDKTKLTLDITNSFSKIDIEILNTTEPSFDKVRGLPRIKLIEHDYPTEDNVLNISISKSASENPYISNIKLSNKKIEKDSLKTAFYNFTKGDTLGALTELKEYYANIDPDDDYAKMQMALKLINMTYFNFAAEVLDDIKEREVWGKMIDELYKLYFPKNMLPENIENVQVTSYYLLEYKNKPEHVIEITQNSQNFDYLYYLRAKAHKASGNLEEAKKDIDIAIGLYPENFNYKLELIDILSAQNEVRTAQMELNQLKTEAKKINLTNNEFWKNYNIYEKWLKVKEFREYPATSKYYEAYYYAAKGELSSAVDILNKIVYKFKEAYIYELMGEIFYELGQYDAARKAFNETLVVDPNRVKAIIGKGNIYFITGNNELAEKYYQEAVDKFPRNVDTLMAMAKFQGYLGNSEKSYEYFKKILEIEPQNSDVIYNIGIILANKGEVQESEKLIKKALADDPMRSMIWLDLARIEMARHNYINAVKYLKYANYIDEKNPYYYYYIAIILNKHSKKSEAEKYMRKAIDLNPDLISEITKGK